MTYTRKCSDWLSTYTEWTLPRSESPETMIQWSGLFTLASVMKRNVMVPKTMMGSYDIVPNMYVIFVGPAGGPRKTTTVDYSLELLSRLPQIKKAADLTSKEALVDELLKTEGCALTVIAGELGEFFAKSGPEMFGTLTNLWDSKRDLQVNTLSRSVQFGEKPCLNLIGATTPAWIAEHVPESAIGGGFASRTIFVFEPTTRRRKLYYKELDYDQIQKLREQLTDDLQHIAGIVGEYEIDKEAAEYMEDWYQKMVLPTNTKLHGYWQRRHTHAHKVAMLVKASYSDELVLRIPDFEKAIQYLKEIEIKLPDVFIGIGRNKYVIDAKVMAGYIRMKCLEGGAEYLGVPRKEMIEEFYAVAEPEMLDRLIKSLMDMEYVGLHTTYENSTQMSNPHYFYKWLGE